MRNLPRKTAQCLIQTNLLNSQKIGSLALKQIVVLFLNDEIDISRLHFRHFVAHAAEGDFFIVAHALFNVHLEHLAFGFVRALLSLSLTRVARPLHLRDHTRANLANLHNGSLSFASGTFDGRAFDDLSVHSEFNCFAIVEILQADLKGMIDRWSFTRTSASGAAAAATEEHREKILTSSRSDVITRDALEAEFVVLRTFFFVTQNFIGCADLLEFVLVAALVGVVRPT
mmetsp:Transcript_23263/g.48661  ORF Transcript_23263/g.48661 Transcript_23263/m.48661 type:complete len:229 (-) Transcript_23263:124-810(-)